jgi:SAM-dependent methyltransferase
MKFFKRIIRKINARIPRTQAGIGPVVGSICITMVKNEQDIIEVFLRNNRPFFDAMIVMDNGSTDQTRKIIVACARELGGIFLIDTPTFDYAQSDYVTAALHYAQSAFFADYVCFLDADEFIGASNRDQFFAALSGISAGAASTHPWQTFLPDPDAPLDPKIDPVTRMTYRRRAENPQYSKVILRLGGSLIPALTIRRGAHRVSSGRLRKIAVTPLRKLPFLHFPVRNTPQLLAKGVLGWMANLANDPTLATATSSKHPTSFQWKRIFNIAQSSDVTLTPTQLSDEAMAYAQHVGPATFAENAVADAHGLNLYRAYSDGQSDDYFRAVATSLIRSGKRPPVFTVTPPDNPDKTKSDVSTAFDSDWHWQHIYFDAAPFRSFIERHQPKSVFDIGCGKGLYLRFLSNLGVSEVFGVDGVEQSVTVLNPSEYQKVDLHLAYDAKRRFDVVFCLEVAEHLHPEATDTIFDTIAAHAEKTIVFSMAEPGQGGHGHINCRPISDVLGMWRNRGWVPDLTETLGFRALSTMSWFRRNIVILKPATAQADDGATTALCRIAALNYNWYNQEPGIRHYAFEEPYPTGAAGYSKVSV